MKITKDYLVHEYVNNKCSTYDIAVKCHTYPNAIRRALIKYHIPLRDKSEAQTLAIQTGRHQHPTRGKKHSEQVKIKISEGVSKAWRDIDEQEKNERIAAAKSQWEEMTEEQKEQFRRLAAEAVRKAAEKGSKLEQFLLLELKSRGYNVLFHKKQALSVEELQIDLLLPDLKVAIEVDGPTHFFPIWGEANLAKHLTSDHIKTGLILSNGYTLIRIKNLMKNASQIQYRKLLTNLLHRLELVDRQNPSLIEIELL